MASKLLRSSSCAHSMKCAYGTVQPAALQVPGTQLTAIKSSDGVMATKMPNNSFVVSTEHILPVSSISFIYRSGCRFENVDNVGVSHLLRLYTGLKTKNMSAFMHTRVLQQAAIGVTACVGREHMQYGVTGLMHDNISTAWKSISEFATEPLFRQWELDELIPKLEMENNLVEPAFQTMELLHMAAYQGRGLGRSLMMPDYMLNKINEGDLKAFHASTHTTDRLSIVGLGCDHKWLIDIANELQDTTASVTVDKSIYFGGIERRSDINRCAYVAIAGKGASIGSQDAVELAVAENILGAPNSLKYGSTNLLENAMTRVGGSGEVHTINVNYSDSGLFGMIFIIEQNNVNQVTKELLSTLKNLKFTEHDLQGAKKRTKAQILEINDNLEKQVEWASKHVLATGATTSVGDFCNAIDKVTVTSVKAAVKKVMSSKLSMAAYGNIEDVPHLEQL